HHRSAYPKPSDQAPERLPRTALHRDGARTGLSIHPDLLEPGLGPRTGAHDEAIASSKAAHPGPALSGSTGPLMTTRHDAATPVPDTGCYDTGLYIPPVGMVTTSR